MKEYKSLEAELLEKVLNAVEKCYKENKIEENKYKAYIYSGKISLFLLCLH